MNGRDLDPHGLLFMLILESRVSSQCPSGIRLSGVCLALGIVGRALWLAAIRFDALKIPGGLCEFCLEATE